MASEYLCKVEYVCDYMQCGVKLSCLYVCHDKNEESEQTLMPGHATRVLNNYFKLHNI
jgi:hypothetical protein